MKTPLKIFSLLAGSALAAASFLNAATTDPVGYVTTTTPNGDDSLLGIPLTQSPAFQGTAVSVNGPTITVNTSLEMDSLAGTHYLLAKSGTNQGQWSAISSNTTDSITTVDELLSAVDSFEVIPFWTLSTLFPEGEGVGVSNDPNLPSSVVLVNNLEGEGTDLSSLASFFYFPGAESVPAGWYQTGVFTPSDNLVLSPETYITVRNETGEKISTVISGRVPTSVVGTKVVSYAGREQDNQLANPYPAPLTLGTSGLTNAVRAAANPNLPEDTVLIFDSDATPGQDISVSASYFYFAGVEGVPAGWYQTGNFNPSNDVSIPAGGAFIVRKGAGENKAVRWEPPVPYIL